MPRTPTRITDAAPGSGARDDDTIPDVPRWTATAFAGYSAGFRDRWRFNLRAEYQYQSSARFSFDRTLFVTYADGVVGTVPNASEFRQSYDVVNAFASVGDERTKLRLYVNNIFDARPLLDLDLVTGSDKALTIRPRTIGFEVRRSF